ncbi:hypothetical protein LG290_09050 [Halomonas sediminis]
MTIDFLSLERLRERTRDGEAELSFWVAEPGRYDKRAEARDRLGLSTRLAG